METPSVVLVLGMHRSGTSSVAELIAHAGYQVPGDQLPVAEEVNARGFWESRQVVDFNERILSESGLSWFSLQMSNVDISDSLYSEMLEWLTLQIKLHQNLVIKDPRINILLPVWCRLLDELSVDLHIVFVNRYPDFVASSLEKRDGFSLHTGFALWLKYNWEALSALNNRSATFVDFEELVSSVEEKKFLIESLGKQYIQEEFSHIIDGELVRNSKVLTEITTDVVVMARSLHQFLQSKARSSCVVEFAAITASAMERVANYYRDNRSVLECLDDANAKLVYARKKMIENGRLYSEAVLVINEKDKALSDNAAYIAACHDRIASMQHEVDRCIVEGIGRVEIKPLYEQTLSALADSLSREKTTAQYIEMCHSRIAELYGSLRMASERADKLAVTLMDQERLLRNNNSLNIELSRLMSEKNQLEVDLVEIESFLQSMESELSKKTSEILIFEKNQENNKLYIEKCHAQIAYLHDAIADKEMNEAEARSYIDRCHAQISRSDTLYKDLQASFQRLSEELAEVKDKYTQLVLEAELKDAEIFNSKAIEKDLSQKLLASEDMHAVVSKELHRLNFKLTKIWGFVNDQAGFNDLSDVESYASSDFDEYKLLEMARQRIEARQLVNVLLEEQISNIAEIEGLKLQLLTMSNDPIAGLINKKIISRMNHCD